MSLSEAVVELKPEQPTPKQALKRHEQAVASLERYLAEPEVATVLRRITILENEVKESREALKPAFTGQKLNTRVTGKRFGVRWAAQDRGHYDPLKLPFALRYRPGVVKLVVDAKALADLVKSGEVHPSVIAPAWVSNWTKPYPDIKPLKGTP